MIRRPLASTFLVPTYSTSTSGFLFRAGDIAFAGGDFFFFGRADSLTARVDNDEFFMAMQVMEESVVYTVAVDDVVW